MDLTAGTKAIAPTVKQTGPPIGIAASLSDLFALPSCNMKSPRIDRVEDKMTSKNVDTLLMKSRYL
jgi:hypothetical protein